MADFYPFGQFVSPYDRDDLAEKALIRDGLLLADTLRERFDTVLESLAYVAFEWLPGHASNVTRHTAEACLLERATAAEQALWNRARASGCVLSVEDMRWWVDAETRRLAMVMREAAWRTHSTLSTTSSHCVRRLTRGTMC